MEIPRPIPANLESQQAWWQYDIETARGQPSPAFKGGARYDVVVIGGGFTGLWTALTLKQRRPQLQVAVLEAFRTGDGASTRNGGIVHGYWQSLASNIKTLGVDAALDLAHLGSRAQDAFRAYASACDNDVEWREAGNLRVSTCPAQERQLDEFHQQCQGLGVERYIQALAPEQVSEIIGSRTFGKGLFFPEAGNVHPGKLMLALKRSVLQAGVELFERSPVLRIDDTQGVKTLRLPDGVVMSPQVVLAINANLARIPGLASHFSVFSSFAAMSEPAEDALKSLGWHRPVGVNDARMFLHYFRKTADDRVLMGSGSGPIGFTGGADHPRLRSDPQSIQRAQAGLAHLLPSFASTPIAKSWGWPIDVSADRIPFFRTLRPGIHYGGGYSGHGVQATWIAGQCLSSLVLGQQDEWSRSLFCTRPLPSLPPEPIKYLGANAIRWGILSCEEAEQRRERARWTAKGVAALPKLLGLRIGVR
ncbi:NAD(P)/FAD-dependent oxidoreductase [Pseudomonas sp. LP23]|uniref:NAD(P)/FAD-dependent oxidoreductase n=1 Tax=Pseudomonas sp. LP23 TaxID=3029195 RepID=UPI0030BF0DB3